jgi:signal transduction histidine kinase
MKHQAVLHNSASGAPWINRLLLRAIITVMILILFAGVGAAARLATYLGQPTPGFALFWRKEYKLFIVGWMTPPHWSGITAGLKVNDRILCINGYMPSPDSVIYGLDPRYAQHPCVNGKKNFAEIYREVYRSADPSLSFFIDRDGKLMIVSHVPLAPFTLGMLLDVWLPFFLVGLGLLVTGAVALYTNPVELSNLLFTILATIATSFILQQGYIPIFSDFLRDTRLVTLFMMTPWIPMVGVVIFHLTDRLVQPSPFSRMRVVLLRPFYGLSAFFALFGVFLYLFHDLPLTYPLTNWYNLFVVVSAALGVGWGLVILGWAWRWGSTRRVRARSKLVFQCLAFVSALLVPYTLAMIPDGPSLPYLQDLLYLGLGSVAFLSYVILRYHVYATKGRVLMNLLLLSLCTLVAHLVSLLVGNRITFLPILLGALITAYSLESRVGPFAALDRFLRRERLDYQAVTDFSQSIGGIMDTSTLVRMTAGVFGQELAVEQTDCWLRDAEKGEWRYFNNGVPRMLQDNFPCKTLEDWLNLRPEITMEATPFGLPLGDADDNLWVPLYDNEHTIGLLRLGPRWTGEAWVEDDLRLVTILSRRLFLSILNIYQFDRLQAMQHRLVQAEENERTKIARELHDTVLQFLLVLNYGLDDLKDRPGNLIQDIERWQDRIGAEAGQLRDLVSYLRSPEILVHRGLASELRIWLDQVSQETSTLLTVEIEDRAGELLLLEAQIALYRVFREAVHNAIKHARARSIKTQLKQEANSIVFEISDDGIGFVLSEKLQTSERYRSLRDLYIYVESAGGQLEIYTAPGSGTRIKGTFPATYNLHNRLEKEKTYVR